MSETVTSSVAVVGKSSDLDFIQDLQIIAKDQPGKGAALQRMIDRADSNQTELAGVLGLSRSYVSMWCSETKWPPEDVIRNALLALKIDRKLILAYLGPVVVSSETEFDPQALAVTVFSKLFLVDDPFERERVIYDTLWEKALIAQGIRASKDVRAFVAFSEEKRRHEEESRKRRTGSARNVTPSQATWMQNPYDKKAPDTTTSSPDLQHNDTPDTPDSQDTDNKQV